MDPAGRLALARPLGVPLFTVLVATRFIFSFLVLLAVAVLVLLQFCPQVCVLAEHSSLEVEAHPARSLNGGSKTQQLASVRSLALLPLYSRISFSLLSLSVLGESIVRKREESKAHAHTRTESLSIAHLHAAAFSFSKAALEHIYIRSCIVVQPRRRKVYVLCWPLSQLSLSV